MPEQKAIQSTGPDLEAGTLSKPLDVSKVGCEGQQPEDEKNSSEDSSVFKSLGFLDRFLAAWIFLAMLIGILLGNFVEGAGDALQKGKFAEVSVPIGKFD